MVTSALVIPNFSVVEMVSFLYQDLNLISQFLLDNPNIGQYGVDANLDLFTGDQVSYDPALSNFTPAPLSFTPPPQQVTTGSVTGQFGISIYDLTLQSYGSLDELAKLMVDNFVGGVDDPNIDRSMIYTLQLAQSQQMNKYNAFNSIIYATLWSQLSGTPPYGFLELESALSTGGGPYVLLEDAGHIIIN